MRPRIVSPVFLLCCFCFTAACGARSGQLEESSHASGQPVLFCGPGTTQVGDTCVPAPEPLPIESDDAGGPVLVDLPEAGRIDSAAPIPDAGIDANLPPMPPDAGPTSGYAVDPAHDNADPSSAIHSPLTVAWTSTFGGTVSYPVVVGTNAIVAAAEVVPDIRALDLVSGAVVWGPLTLSSQVTLAAEGTRVFALDEGGKLTAFDAASGLELWTSTIPGEPYYWSPPVASGGLVYVNALGQGGMITAVDEASGSAVWTASTFDGSEGTVAVSAGVLYEAEVCDQLYAFDALTGTRRWYESGTCLGGGGAAPAVYQGLIWDRDDVMGNVIYDSAGNTKGSFNASVIPSFHAGTVFYQYQGIVSAADVASGATKWTFAGDTGVCTSAVIAGAGGQVFVGSQLGYVYELDELTGEQISVSDTGALVSCGSELQAMAIGGGRLLVPAGNTLLAY